MHGNRDLTEILLKAALNIEQTDKGIHVFWVARVHFVKQIKPFCCIHLRVLVKAMVTDQSNTYVILHLYKNNNKKKTIKKSQACPSLEVKQKYNKYVILHLYKKKNKKKHSHACPCLEVKQKYNK